LFTYLLTYLHRRKMSVRHTSVMVFCRNSLMCQRIKRSLWQYSDRDPDNGASNARGYEQIAMFRYKPISETIQDSATVTMECK